MMRWLFILGMTYLAFMLELICAQSFGAWGNPQWLIILLVFICLFLGIRYGIGCALLAGLARDAVGIAAVGTNLLVYMIVAYGIIYIRKILYQPGSRLSRIVMVFIGVSLQVIATMILLRFQFEINILEMLYAVFFPSIITTIIVATPVFIFLKSTATWMRLK